MCMQCIMGKLIALALFEIRRSSGELNIVAILLNMSFI
jgi:hypothetical protein